MTMAAPSLKTSLEQRVEQAISETLQRVAKVDARRVSVEDQKRHIGRMITCQVSLSGSGWVGSLTILLPATAGSRLTQRVSGKTTGDGPKGPDIAEAMGTIAASIGIAFGKSFNDEDQIVIGMPTVLAGGDVAISFPWGKDFETRQCFTTDDHPLWVILRLSHTRR
ncbi:MAG: hypothetical protein ACI97A_001548 [Planctomycetota bacterium]|jgi:hypothetical protein